MSSIENKQQEITQVFSMFESWIQKYEYLIELGRDLPAIDPEFRDDDHLIRGCQSRVWLHAALDSSGRLRFTADSDALITRGLVALVIGVLDGETPKDVLAADLHFVKDIGLDQHLSPSRNNGLAAMITQMKYYGLAFQASA